MLILFSNSVTANTKLTQSLLITLCVFFPLFTLAQEVPDEVNAAAQQGLSLFLEQIPENEKERFGFSGEDVISRATLGEVYRLHTIPPDALMQYMDDNTAIASIMEATEMWYFLVMLRDSARSILVVDRINREYRAVSLGLSKTARQLQKVAEHWPLSEGYNLKVINIFQANQFLVAVPEASSRDVVALSGPNIAVRRNGEMELANAYEVLQQLAPAVFENLRQNQ